MKARSAASLFATALLVACFPSVQLGGGPPGVTLDVEPPEAPTAPSVALVLTNGSAGAIGYNLCTSGLERRAGEDWQPVPSDRVCTLELRTLPPGERARYTVELPPGLAPGEYRFHTDVETLATGERSAVRSGAFRVPA